MRIRLETPIALHSVAHRVSHQIPAESEMSRQIALHPPKSRCRTFLRNPLAHFLGEAKPECQTGGFPTFSGKVQSVSRTLSGLFLIGAVNRPRKRKRTNRENRRRVPGKKGKIPKNRKSPKKDKKGQKKERQVQIGKHPRLKTPPV